MGFFQRFQVGALTLVAMVVAIPTGRAQEGAVPAVQGQLHFALRTGRTGQRVAWVSNANGWDSETHEMVEGPKGTYSLDVPEPWLETLRYKFVVNGRWISDPANPNREADGQGGWNSTIALSFSEDPLLSAQPGVVPLKEVQLDLPFGGAGALRPVTVLLPVARTPVTTVYFQDGGDYLERTGVRNLLANLAREPGMPALAGVFIPPVDRMSEYGLTGKTLDYAAFVRKTVLPVVEARFGIGGDRTRRVVIGPSLGGLVSLYLASALRREFGYVVSQSGSLWFQDRVVVDWFQTAPLAGVKLFFDVGLYETEGMISSNRALAEVLAERGDVAFTYREYPTSHNWLGWRNRLSESLRALLKEEGGDSR